MFRIADSRVGPLMISLAAGAVLASLVWWVATREDGERPSSTLPGQVAVTFSSGPREAASLIESSGRFEHVVDTINTEIELPDDLDVRVVGDRTAIRMGVTGPTYVPSERTVYFPWAFVVQSHDDLVSVSRRTSEFTNAEIDEVLAASMEFVLYHELSHGILDQLDVPVLAGEEHTADSLATVLSLVSDREGEALPLSAAILELARAQAGGEPSLADFADDHGLDRQRAFNAICAVYGSAPEEHERLLSGPNALPPARAELCTYDFEKLVEDWRTTLDEHLTSQGALLPPGYETPSRPPQGSKRRNQVEDDLAFGAR